MKTCVYVTANSQRNFHCESYQKCCTSDCCMDSFRWYYWISLTLSFVLLIIALIFCWCWKHHRYNSRVVDLNGVAHQRFHRNRIGSETMVLPMNHHQQQTHLCPTYGWILPSSVSQHTLNSENLHMPVLPNNNLGHQQMVAQTFANPPPSYDQLFGEERSREHGQTVLSNVN